MSLEEWTKLFFHEEPQSASYVDGAPLDTVDEDPSASLEVPADLPPPEAPDVEPIVAESPQPAAGFAGVAVKSEVEKKMVLVTELTLDGPHKASGNKAYTATDATWIEAHDFCQEAGARLCFEQVRYHMHCANRSRPRTEISWEGLLCHCARGCCGTAALHCTPPAVARPFTPAHLCLVCKTAGTLPDG